MTTEPRRDFYTAVPKLREVANDLIYGDIWERPQLSKRDRSMITCAALIAMKGQDEVGAHINRALDNGVTREEISELITHITFYIGWPAGVNAARKAQEIFDARPE
jgi:4-carboxymuconolactone decarboxylase